MDGMPQGKHTVADGWQPLCWTWCTEVVLAQGPPQCTKSRDPRVTVTVTVARFGTQHEHPL